MFNKNDIEAQKQKISKLCDFFVLILGRRNIKCDFKKRYGSSKTKKYKSMIFFVFFVLGFYGYIKI